METPATNNGWIKLHRKMLEWEWWDDSQTLKLFLYLLIKANHQENKWRGIAVARGQHITSYEKMAYDCHFSIQRVRTSIKRLKSTGELTYQSTSRYGLITLLNYNQYQGDNTPANSQLTVSQQATNRQLTTNNKEKKDKNENNLSGDKSPPNLKTKPVKEWTTEEQEAHPTMYLLRCFSTLYENRYKSPPVINYGQFGKRLKELNTAPLDTNKIKFLMRIYFSLQDNFVIEARHSFSLFCSTDMINKLISNPLFLQK